MDLLEQGPFSARELSGIAGMREREVVEHLEHIARSAKRAGRILRVSPPSCRLCGYTFRNRGRLSVPGRCPACRKGSVDPPVFSLEGA